MSILFALIKDIFRTESPVKLAGSKLVTYSLANDTDIHSKSIMLHIGGQEAKPGWKILNIQPGENVDYVGDIADLSQFPDGMFHVIYASHVLEHVPQGKILSTLKEINRILGENGKLLIAVPDLEILCTLFIQPELDKHDRLHVMSMIYGGQIDPFDYHFIGFTYEFLLDFLHIANFKSIQRVANFNIFNDTSSYIAFGIPISLNLVAHKKTPQ
jgi:predicted SAM-dependent methyltransferase